MTRERERKEKKYDANEGCKINKRYIYGYSGDGYDNCSRERRYIVDL